MKLSTLLHLYAVCLSHLLTICSASTLQRSSASTLQRESASTDQHGSLAINNLRWTDLTQEDTEMIQRCVSTEFQVAQEQKSNVQATIVRKTLIEAPNPSLRRGLNSYGWIFDIFIRLLFNGCSDCLSQQVDDDMLFRRLSTTTSISQDICSCLQSSGHSKFSKIQPNDCSMKLTDEFS